MTRAAVFLDRDGTLNVEVGYLNQFEDWEWIPGAVEAIRRINQMGYLAIVVTNQAGIARGYYDAPDMHELHRRVNRLLAQAGARIDAYYFCPHHPDHGEVRSCACRKPEPGMLLQARREFDIDLAGSWLIGDKLSDVEAGLRAGVSPILVLTGYGAQERGRVAPDIPCEADVLAAVRRIECSRPDGPDQADVAGSFRQRIERSAG